MTESVTEPAAAPIALDGVRKSYPAQDVPALRDITLSVEPGTFLVLLGPSGSGKTTLLRCLAGIERVSAGRISIGGVTVADGAVHVPPEKRELSMVFQDYALWPHLTAAQNVAFALRRRRVGRAAERQRAEAMLRRVGLAALAGRYPNQLSGGEQQRVALARALVAGTGLILCDEPLSNLDADLRERLRVEIAELVRDSGATTVYITHDQAEAFALADRVGVLERGALVQLGPPEEIYTRPASPFVARFTGLSGELTVRTAPAPVPGWVDIEPAGPAWAGPLRVPATAAVPGGGKALLMIRPTGVALSYDPGGEQHLTGIVADAAFRGRGYEHAVDIPGHGRLAGVLGPRRAPRGSRVGLRLEPAGCHLFPVPGETGMAAAAGTGPAAAAGQSRPP
jgi:iron(III) transport system ATP-binding protein